MSTLVTFSSMTVIRSPHTSRHIIGRKMSTLVRFNSMIVIRSSHTSRHHIRWKMSTFVRFSSMIVIRGPYILGIMLGEKCQHLSGLIA